MAFNSSYTAPGAINPGGNVPAGGGSRLRAQFGTLKNAIQSALGKTPATPATACPTCGTGCVNCAADGTDVSDPAPGTDE